MCTDNGVGSQFGSKLVISLCSDDAGTGCRLPLGMKQHSYWNFDYGQKSNLAKNVANFVLCHFPPRLH